MEPKATTPPRPVVARPAPRPPHLTTIREVRGIHVLDHKDDAIHPGPTGTRAMTRSVTAL